MSTPCKQPGPVIMLILIAGVILGLHFSAANSAMVAPAPREDAPKTAGPPQSAVLAGGCFWGVQGVFEHVRGVRRVIAGYAGGDQAHANYAAVSGGDTGHAESVQIIYDPGQISFGELLRVYFSVAHDPTQRNRQGPDIGSQYRSVIFTADDEQRRIAEAYIAQLDRDNTFGRKLATQVQPLRGFYPAENDHQDFLIRHPSHPYIVVNDLPKIRDLQRSFPRDYRETPVTAGE